ncbi:MAG TPA: NAD-dependent epimerase/dehydratase family protein [Chitinophagales bacterium]|jgi:CDP-paratose 2-epimerase|nr:NAD-dependent epimerase/dehydratase family protein [Chitinophagales bacterium]HQV76984.1 NAD-dependent epimerase/dehydratase family protein [Chitinophagales bacterium]HQW77949.1 NAD-dependent epimerase/dehydratase family protein [Chitinophagales bacterium]HRB18854.1 NAD-dependent epimerase/dehydratase family protein [Chitinophagales bacterium]HRB67223.1 NAD-dependent epimerase/dehydratase family protein [Chitinophagales bacterium]
MNTKNILITGGAGFVGSQMALSIKNKYPKYELFVLDNLKRRGSELNIPRLKAANIHFIHGDIRNKEDFDGLPVIDCIIEASAEPSVLAGIDSTPDYLINTNLNGTINCLNFASKNKSDFIFLSTSRIYPIETIENINYTEAETRFEIAAPQSTKGFSQKGISEDFPLDNYRSLYGTTKLASELFIQEYKQFFGLKTVINRCGVLTGPWQMGKIDQGVVVLWLAKHFWNQQLSYIGYGGKGKQVRDMLHTADLFRLIDWQIHHIDDINGEIFNVGGGREISLSLKEMTALCEEITGNKIPIKEVPENRTADIRIYITDNSKVTEKTGWEPQISPKQIFSEIYDWMKENEQQLAGILK